MTDTNLNDSSHNIQHLPPSPLRAPNQRRSGNHNQTINETTENKSNVVLKRKMPRKKKKDEDKIKTITIKIEETMRFSTLCQYVKIANDLSNWYCALCKRTGKTKCGTVPCKSVVVRQIIIHLQGQHHRLLLPADLKKIDLKRIALDQEKEDNNNKRNKNNSNNSNISNISNNNIEIAVDDAQPTSSDGSVIFDANNTWHTNIRLGLLKLNKLNTFNIEQMKLNKINNFCKTYNNVLCNMFIKLMKQYYPVSERKWMKAESDLIDPKFYFNLSETLQENKGNKSIRHLLDHWGKSKDNGLSRIFAPIINYNKCLSEYNQWKKKGFVESEEYWNINDDYERCVGFYQCNYNRYNDVYPEWFSLWLIILLNINSSMSLERLFRVRKLFQLEYCSAYKCKGLTHLLRLYYNSAKLLCIW